VSYVSDAMGTEPQSPTNAEKQAVSIVQLVALATQFSNVVTFPVDAEPHAATQDVRSVIVMQVLP
jgi:hypothetical protein